MDLDFLGHPAQHRGGGGWWVGWGGSTTVGSVRGPRWRRSDQRGEYGLGAPRGITRRSALRTLHARQARTASVTICKPSRKSYDFSRYWNPSSGRPGCTPYAVEYRVLRFSTARSSPEGAACSLAPTNFYILSLATSSIGPLLLKIPDLVYLLTLW